MNEKKIYTTTPVRLRLLIIDCRFLFSVRLLDIERTNQETYKNEEREGGNKTRRP